MGTIVMPPAAQRHVCRPPTYRPKDEWDTVAPPLAFMRPEDRPTAKPRAIPTRYPYGTLWTCVCGRAWCASRHDGCAPPTYLWTPVRWWQWRLQRRLREAQS